MRNLFTSRARKGAIATILGVCAFTALVAAPGASATTVYNNVPNAAAGQRRQPGLRGDVDRPSSAARSSFAGTARHNPQAHGHDEQLGVPERWREHRRLLDHAGRQVHRADSVQRLPRGRGREPGRLIGAVTHTYNIPYRPSANYTQVQRRQVVVERR